MRVVGNSQIAPPQLMPSAQALQLAAIHQATGAALMRNATVVDLMFNACGESYDSLQPHAVTVDSEGVLLRTVSLAGLLTTKQSSREIDQMERMILERALATSKKES